MREPSITRPYHALQKVYPSAMPRYTVAIAGLGAIGLKVARAIDSGNIPGLTLTAIAARDTAKAERNLAAFKAKPAIVPSRQSLLTTPTSSSSAFPPLTSARRSRRPSKKAASSCRSPSAS